MIALISAALLAGLAPEATHRVTLNQAETPVQAEYRAALDIRMEERGLSAGTRPGTSQCHWRAFAQVTRSVAGAGLPDRAFPAVAIGKGYRAGGCLETRSGVRADAERHRDRMGQVLVETAQRDEATLLAEATGSRQLAASD